MVRIAVFLTAMIGSAAPAAAAQIERTAEPEVITIEVAPEDLDRCEATLAQVLSAPVDGTAVQPVDAPAMPTAVCVLRKT